MKSIIITLSLVFTGLFAQAETMGPKVDTLVVKSSMVCEMCIETLTEALMYTKGVRDLAFDLESNEITIVYKTQKTSPEALRMAIAEKGYWADDVPPKEEGYAKLHECCKAPHD